jgi:2,5-diketo-D-gluconate reductase A
MASVPTITLNNGVEIPQLGFGVFQIEPAGTREATLTALEVGYRHIDPAQMYGNEKEVGQAVRDSGLDRGGVFVTSKLNNGFHARDDALRAFDQTLADLGLDYLDLFLVHWPLPGIEVDYVETWTAMEEIYRSGRARAIGVSNVQEHHLRPLFGASEFRAAVNQV